MNSAAQAPLRTVKGRDKAGVHSVHSLDRIVYTVPDLAEGEKFFDTFGLDVRRHGNQLDLYTHGHPHLWVSVHAAPGPKKLQYLRFGCFAEDLEAIGARLDKMGIARCAPHPLGDASGIWIKHPDGFALQITVAPKSSPDVKSTPFPRVEVPVGKGAAPGRSQVHKVRPRRMTHALFFTTDAPRAIAFYEEALGMRVSDRSGDAVVFMHGVHGSDHHMLAMLQSDGPGLHHSSWDVGGIDEIGLGMEQLLSAGYSQGWGLGRHVLGSNYFYYARDPWGSYAELSFDIDYVPADHHWVAANHPPEDSFYVWGPAVPPEFGTNFETAVPA